jgi:hypothetical protein
MEQLLPLCLLLLPDPIKDNLLDLLMLLHLGLHLLLDLECGLSLSCQGLYQ